jgi:hypothetical protein
MSFEIFAFQGDFEVLYEGRGKEGVLKFQDVAQDLCGQLEKVGFFLDEMEVSKCFAEIDSEKDFFVQFSMESDSIEKIIEFKGYESDSFNIDEREYHVKYLLGEENSIIIFDDKEVYISNNLSKAYEKISEKNYLQKRISEFIKEDLQSDFSQVFHETGENIYGKYTMKALEYTGSSFRETYFYEKKGGIRERHKIPFDGRLIPIMTYDELATLLLEEIPEVVFSGDNVKKIVEKELKGAFILEKEGKRGVVLMIKKNKYRNFLLKQLYAQDIFEKIGLDIKNDGGVNYFSFPFFKLKKYIVEFDNGVMLTSEKEFLKNRKTENGSNVYIVGDERITLEHKGDIDGYFGIKEGAFSVY